MTQCHLVQDLLVPYLAAEVSPDTRAWVNGHLDGCTECRALLESMVEPAAVLAAPTAVPSPEPGRRLIRRVGRTVTLVVAGLVTLAVLTVGFGFMLLKLTDLPVTAPPVPTEQMAPAEVAKTNLGLVGLQPMGAEPTDHGVAARFQTRTGETVTVTYEKFATAQAAKEAYQRWNSSFKTRLMSAETDRGSWSSAKWRSGGVYHQAWYQDTWFIRIQVPEATAEAAQLRTDLHDALLIMFRYMQ